MAGIRNKDPEDHQYIVTTSVEQVPLGVTKGEVKWWVKYLDSATLVKSEETSFSQIDITIPRDAKKGMYLFYISSCYDKDNVLLIASECGPNSANLWATPWDFILTVK